jgi:hypothetical protein
MSARNLVSAFLRELPEDTDPAELALVLMADAVGYFVMVHGAEVATDIALGLIGDLAELENGDEQ